MNLGRCASALAERPEIVDPAKAVLGAADSRADIRPSTDRTPAQDDRRGSQHTQDHRPCARPERVAGRTARRSRPRHGLRQRPRRRQPGLDQAGRCDDRLPLERRAQAPPPPPAPDQRQAQPPPPPPPPPQPPPSHPCPPPATLTAWLSTTTSHTATSWAGFVPRTI